eukprot:TRINITY_DN5404_c0_g2_i3.p1 TRINITY_DN5404_c0_g2~~TRINITY_DN5404_c0_g2_i3.p1  ORF type:complete len:1596 (+),score=363.65 TRINITY_DN5404_c0_g2_i3:400-4788(+)
MQKPHTHDLSAYMGPIPTMGSGPTARTKGFTPPPSLYDHRRIPQSRDQIHSVPPPAKKQNGLDGPGRASAQEIPKPNGLHHHSPPDVSIKIRNSLLKLQRILNGGSSFVDDFFNQRFKDAEIVSKIEQAPASMRRSALTEVVNLCRYLVSNQGGKVEMGADRQEYDARSFGGLATPSPVPDIIPYFNEGNSGHARNQPLLPPVPRAPQVPSEGSSKAPSEVESKSSLIRSRSQEPSRAQLEELDAEVQGITRNHAKSSNAQLNEISIEPPRDPAPDPAPQGSQLNTKALQRASSSNIQSFFDVDNDFGDTNGDAEGAREKPALSRKGSVAKIQRAWMKLKVIRTVFSSNNTYYTNPQIAKKVFSLLSTRRTQARQKFLQEWSELDKAQQNDWVQELANQFTRVGTTLTVLSDATTSSSFTESLKSMTSTISDVVMAKYVHIYRVEELFEKYHLLASTSSDPWSETLYDFGDGLPGRVIQTNEATVIDQYAANDTDDFELNHQLNGFTVYCHPLHDQSEKVIGALLVSATSLSVEDKRILDTLSAHAGLLMSNAVMAEREIRIRKRFSALVDIANIISSELRLEPLIDVLRVKSRELLEADKCTMYLVDREKQELWTTLEEGQEIHFPINQGIAGHVATTGETVNIEDAYNDSRFNRAFDTQTGYRTRSILCMPIKRRGGEIVGVIQMINKSRGSFIREDEDLLEAFCSQAAIAITNSQMYSDEIKQKQMFQALVDISKVVSSELQLKHLIDILRVKSRELVHADRCTLFLVNQGTNELWTTLAEGEEIHVPLGAGIVGHVAQSGQTLNITNAYDEPRFNPDVDKKTGYTTKNILCMPVRTHDGKIVGAIQMVNKTTGTEFNPDDEQLLTAFCTHAAVAIVNSQLYEKTKELNSYLHNILKSIKYYVLHIGNDGRLQSVNHSLLDIFGSEDVYFHSTPYVTWFGRKNSQLVTDIKRILSNPEIVVYNPSYSLVPRATNGVINATEINLLGRDVPNPSLVSIPVNYMVVPLKDGKGRQNGVLLMLEDISELESMKKEVGTLQHELGDMRTQASQVIEAPLQMVIRTIQSLAKGRFDPDEAQQQLLKCVSLMSKVDLFKPKIEEMLDGSLDKNTKLWLMNEVALPEDMHFTVAVSWPDLGMLISSSLNAGAVPSTLFDIQLDATTLSDTDLITLIVHMFQHLNLLNLFHIKVESLQAYLEAIRKNYNGNPFHNFQHSFTVTHTVFLMIVNTSASEYLSNQDVFALLLAALSHDLDHPGLTNGFEISSESALATLYNDVSVLENHHSFMAFRLLRSEGNLLAAFQKPEKREIRKLVVNSILATDMGRHFEDLAKLNQRIDTKPLSRENLDDRIFLASMLLHCADLSNPTRIFSQSRMWAERLIREFSLQVEKEKENNLPVSTFMIIPNMLVQSKNEMGFIDFVVEPLWKAAKRVIPELEIYHAKLLENRAEWSKLHVEAQAEAATK